MRNLRGVAQCVNGACCTMRSSWEVSGDNGGAVVTPPPYPLRAAKSRALSDSGRYFEMTNHNIKGERPARVGPHPRAEAPSSSVTGNGSWGRTRAGP